MIEDTKIKDVLVALADANRTNVSVLSTLMTEVAALRDTLNQFYGEKFATVFQQNQLAHMTKTAAIESLNLSLCDEIIERVKAF